MADHYLISDEVNAFLAGADQTQTPALADLAERYAAACREANARLRRCADLISKGLRSEAIAFADSQPALLDVVAALDIPGIEQWEMLCATYALSRAPRILIDAAADLNDAYAAEQPLQSTLVELRLLNLARAPLFDRLRVVRRLRSLDPNTYSWSEDAARLERSLLLRMRPEVDRVIAQANASAATALLDDFSSGQWVESPPSEYVKPLSEIEAQQLLQRASELQSAEDAEGVRAALDRLDKTVAKRRVPLSASLNAAREELAHWLVAEDRRNAEQQRFAQACSELEHALGSGMSLEVVETLLTRVEAFRRPLPNRLKAQIDRDVQRLRFQKARARTRNWLLGVAAVCVVGALVIWQVVRMRADDAARTVIRSVEASLNAKDFDAATKTWAAFAQQNGSLLGRGDVVAIKSRLDEATAAEQKRISRLDELVERLRTESMSEGERTRLVAEANGLARVASERLRVREARDADASKSSAGGSEGAGGSSSGAATQRSN